MINIRGRLHITSPERRLGSVIFALCLSFAVVCPALSDVVELKNGNLIKCKVVKEMQDLIKVRMPHRGKIVTTFLNKGSIKSISKTSDMANRKLFQAGGVHNPGRNYEPVYYSGSAATASSGGRGGKAATKGQKAAAATRKRGIDARRARSGARAKSRSERFSKGTSKGSTGSTSSTGSIGSSIGSSIGTTTSPSTSSSAGQ